jgi:hypothetical protein
MFGFFEFYCHECAKRVKGKYKKFNLQISLTRDLRI